MAQTEIKTKLESFFKENEVIDSEYKAVYFMVELRKLLDYQEPALKRSYSRLRYYCDWVLHTRKDRYHESIRPLIEDVYSGIVNTIQTYPVVSGHESVVDLLYLKDLKKEVVEFLEVQKIQTKNISANEGWSIFIRELLKVLSGQPLYNPTNNISLLRFEHATNSFVWLRVDFKRPIKDKYGKEYEYFQAGNAF